MILGVSRDPLKSHDKFVAKYNLPFLLLSDEGGDVATLYGVLKPKVMYGKTRLGIERSTFVIDRDGVLRRIDRKVKVDGHVDKVLEFVRQAP